MFIRLLLMILALCFSHTAAYASWVEARSENFIFQGDTSEKKAALIIQELEDYRSVLFKALNLNGGAPEVVPVQIYGVKGSVIKKISGIPNIAGYYSTTREGPILVININGSFSKNSQARAITYHEYTHHLISTYSDLVYPRWYNEGYADYLSTFQRDKKGIVKIGLPNEGRIRALAHAESRGSWLDMTTLTQSIRNYPWGIKKSLKNTATQSQFYAQSWLAVHYMVSTEKYANKVKDYLTALNQENPPENIFETTFGISPDDFGELLKDYYKRGKYEGLAIKLAKTDRSYDIKTRKLTKGESEFYHGEAIRRFPSVKESPEISEDYYERAIKAGYPAAQVQASRALIAINNKEEDKAIDYLNQALAQSDKDSRILQIAGNIYLSQYKNKETPSHIEQIKKSRDFLKQAMRANPHNMQAHYDYVSTYGAANDRASGQAVYSAGECAYYYKGNNFIDSNLILAEVLVRNDRFEDARTMLEKAAIWSLSDDIRAHAKQILNEPR